MIRMNVPNLLSLFRLGLIPVYVLIYFSDIPYHHVWALAIFILAGATDVVDGYIARRYDLATPIGAMLDPLADKLMIFTVFLSLIISGQVTIWGGLAIFVRDLGMIIGSAIFHFRGKKTVQANAMGKATTVLYYLAFLFLILDWPYGQGLLWGVILFSYVTSFIYIFQFLLLNQKPVQ